MHPQIKPLTDTDHLDAYRLVAGLDWADNKHDVCLLDLEKKSTKQFTVTHKPDDLCDFIASLRSASGNARIAIVIEQRRGSLINFLIGFEDVDIFPVDASKLASFREAIYPSGRKSDIVDSKLIVEYFVKHGHHLGTPWKPDTPEVRELGFLNEDRRTVVDERTKCVLRLGATLKQYYPLALELFDNLSTHLACHFLKKWPTFESLQRATEATLRQFFYAHNSRSSKKIEQRLKAIKEARPLTTDLAVINALSRRVTHLVKEILAKNFAILAYDKRIKELYKSHEDAKIYASLPGAGEVLEPRLLMVFGTDRERFPEAQNVTEYAGVAPVTKSSGESKKTKRKLLQVRFRYGAPKFQRQSLVEFAACSVQYCPWAKAYYELKSNEGHGRNTILRGLALKWTRVIFRCWQNRETYDEERYVQALKKSGSPVWSKMQQLGLAA